MSIKEYTKTDYLSDKFRYDNKEPGYNHVPINFDETKKYIFVEMPMTGSNGYFLCGSHEHTKEEIYASGSMVLSIGEFCLSKQYMK